MRSSVAASQVRSGAVPLVARTGSEDGSFFAVKEIMLEGNQGVAKDLEEVRVEEGEGGGVPALLGRPPRPSCSGAADGVGCALGVWQ